MKARSTRVIKVVIALLLLSIVGDATAASLFYDNDFSGAVGSEWSDATTSTTPVGSRRFLGEFGKQTVTLELTGLPAHHAVALSFDLFLIRTWDGNNSDFGLNGPDLFSVSVEGNFGLLGTTFSNVYYFDNFPQSYPNAFGAGDFPPFTGASEVNTLGYIEPGNNPADSVYEFDFLFPHVADTLTLQFTSLQSESIATESWGLDNVVVATVPEPSTLELSILGFLGLGIYRRCKRNHAR